jgi:hypothetical protein
LAKFIFFGHFHLWLLELHVWSREKMVSDIFALCMLCVHNLLGSCNNLDADFGSWMLGIGFCIIGLHRLDSTSAAGDGLVAI